ALQRLAVLEDDLLDLFWPSPMRLPEASLEEIDHRLGERELALLVEDVRSLQVVRDEEERHVADHLARRRDLDDVAEELVHVGVGSQDLPPPRGEPQALG